MIQLLNGNVKISNYKSINLTVTKIFTADINTIIHIYPDNILRIDNIPFAQLNKSIFNCTKINSFGKVTGEIIKLDINCNLKFSVDADAEIFPEDYFLGSERTIKLKNKFYSFKDLQDLLWADNIREYFLRSEYKIEEILQTENHEIALKEDIIRFKNCVEKKLIDTSTIEIERLNYLLDLIQDGPNVHQQPKLDEEQNENYIMHLVNNIYKFFFDNEITALIGTNLTD
jgi:hypothetical protein